MEWTMRKGLPEPIPYIEDDGSVRPREETPIVFDFDGVLAVNVWPELEIGAPILDGIELLGYYYGRGYKIVVFTSRPWNDKPKIEQWLRTNTGLWGIEVVCGKPAGALYIDDRALKFPLEGGYVWRS